MPLATERILFLLFIDSTNLRRKRLSIGTVLVKSNQHLLHHWFPSLPLAWEVTFYCQLAALLSRHDSMIYCGNLAWLCCMFSFFLLRSTSMCIRGSHSIHLDSLMLPKNCAFWVALGTSSLVLWQFSFSWVQHTFTLHWGWLAREFHLVREKKIDMMNKMTGSIPADINGKKDFIDS